MRSFLYIFNGRFPTEKAHGIQIAKMCEAYARAGIQVTLMVPRQRNQGELGMYGLKTQFALKRVWAIDPAWLWKFSQKLGHLVRIVSSAFGIVLSLLFIKNDIIYARDNASIILLAILGFRSVVEVHDYRLQNQNFVFAWALSRAKIVICNSEGTKTALAAHYPKVRTEVVPNGVDVNFFDIPETREESRKLLALPQDKIIIGYVGRFEIAGMDKGVSVLKEAFELMQHRDRAYLLLVGGPELSVPYVQVPIYLRAIDIAVIPFPGVQHAKTTSPMKFFEYLAAGKAIVAADAQGPERLAELLDALVAQPEQIKALRAQAREEAKNHTWDARARKILDLINEKP